MGNGDATDEDTTKKRTPERRNGWITLQKWTMWIGGLIFGVLVLLTGTVYKLTAASVQELKSDVKELKETEVKGLREKIEEFGTNSARTETVVQGMKEKLDKVDTRQQDVDSRTIRIETKLDGLSATLKELKKDLKDR